MADKVEAVYTVAPLVLEANDKYATLEIVTALIDPAACTPQFWAAIMEKELLPFAMFEVGSTEHSKTYRSVPITVDQAAHITEQFKQTILMSGTIH